METLKNKVAYLEGMAKGLGVDANSREGKLLTSIIEVLGDFAAELSDLRSAHDDLEDYVEAIDDDLSVVEGADLEDGGSYAQVKCPSCGETLSIDEDDLDDDSVIEVTCPNCGYRIDDEEIISLARRDGETEGVLMERDARPKE